MKQELKFVKEKSGSWFIDLPEWTGSKAELQMVLGADDLLDLISKGANIVSLQVDTKVFKDCNTLSWYAEGIDGDASHGGAMYKLKIFEGEETDFDLWLCDVTKFVFGGEMPDYIYFK